MASFLKKRPRKGARPKGPRVTGPSTVEDFRARAREKRLKELRGRGAKEQVLWQRWDRGGRKPEHLTPLLKSLDPFIKSKVRGYAKQGDIGIPKRSIETKLRQHAMKGIKTFDPKQGTKLTTHIGNKFLAMSDFVHENRNFAHIPKARSQQFQPFRNAQMELEMELGRDPTVPELQKRLQWPNVKDVARMKREIKSELWSGDQGEDQGSSSQIRSMIQLMPSMLKGNDEKKVFGALYPTGGGIPSVKQVARNTGMSEQRVYQLRARILNRAKPYLKKI
tara:strand:- start:387 stop:1220 length:834 start_codon:yes stop_codon:yes gene_type:complete